MNRRRPSLGSRRVRWGAVVLVAAAIFYASVLVDPSGQGVGMLGPHGDKLLHVGAYAVLAFALVAATATRKTSPARRALAAFALAVGYGVLVEFAQAAVPYRQFSAGDVVANAAGALLGVGRVALERRIRSRPDDRGRDSSGRREE